MMTIQMTVKTMMRGGRVEMLKSTLKIRSTKKTVVVRQAIARLVSKAAASTVTLTPCAPSPT